jgi:hypothetical protein
MKQYIKSAIAISIGIALGLISNNTQAQSSKKTIFSQTPFAEITTNEKSVNWKHATEGDKIISNFQEGAAIIKSDNKLGLINTEGYKICKTIYDDIHLFNHGYAAVKKHNKWTYVNKQGQQLTPLRYDWVGGFTHNLSPILKNGKWGVLNEQGFEKIPTKYDAVKIEKDGKVWIKEKGKWEIFNSNPVGNDFADLRKNKKEYIF